MVYDYRQDSTNSSHERDSNIRISSDEKEELINFSVKTRGLSRFHLVMSFFVVFLILSVFIPKIFISNNIYYASREISKLNSEKELLREEKMRLQREVEIIDNKHLLLELGE